MTAGRADGSRVRTVFLGSGGFGRQSLRRLAGHDDIDLIGVVTAPPRPAGRRQRLSTTVIADLARDLGVETILTPERLRSAEAVTSVLDLEPALLVLADYGQIVPPVLLELRHGALNLHPSLLPRHRGATPIPAAILAGDTETGVSLMRMDAGLDTGPIVAQARIALHGTETAHDLEGVLELVGADVVDWNLGPWIRGEAPALPQTETGATLTRPLRREDGRLEPSRPAVELERRVRAFQPWPGSFVDTDLGRLVIWGAGVGAPADRTPGVFGPTGLSTVDGELVLHDVQPAGGNRMPWDAFIRGRPGILGSAALASDS